MKNLSSLPVLAAALLIAAPAFCMDSPPRVKPAPVTVDKAAEGHALRMATQALRYFEDTLANNEDIGVIAEAAFEYDRMTEGAKPHVLNTTAARLWAQHIREVRKVYGKLLDRIFLQIENAIDLMRDEDISEEGITNIAEGYELWRSILQRIQNRSLRRDGTELMGPEVAQKRILATARLRQLRMLFV